MTFASDVFANEASLINLMAVKWYGETGVTDITSRARNLS